MITPIKFRLDKIKFDGGFKMSLNIEERYNHFVEEHGFTFEDVLKYLCKTIDEVDSVKEIKLAIKKMDATKKSR